MEINWNVNLSSKFKKENLMNFILVLLVIIWGWTPSHWSRPSGGLLNVINMNLALNSLHQHITLQTGDEFVILPGLLQYCVSHKDYHSGVPSHFWTNPDWRFYPHPWRWTEHFWWTEAPIFQCTFHVFGCIHACLLRKITWLLLLNPHLNDA